MDCPNPCRLAVCFIQKLMKLEPRTIVRRALITEKGARVREQGKVGNQYFFEVHPDANKLQIVPEGSGKITGAIV